MNPWKSWRASGEQLLGAQGGDDHEFVRIQMRRTYGHLLLRFSGSGGGGSSLKACCAALRQNAKSAPPPNNQYMEIAAAACESGASLPVIQSALRGAGMPAGCK